jgi:predicted nucleic acid-binding protein
MALLRHLTNTTIMGQFVQSQRGAWASYDGFANDPRIVFVQENSESARYFREFTRAATPSHKQWTDGYLAALAVSYDAELVTFDKLFHPFSGLKLHVLT